QDVFGQPAANGSRRGTAGLPAHAGQLPAALALTCRAAGFRAARFSLLRSRPLMLFLCRRFMNYKISSRAASLAPSLTLAIDSKAKQMKADGIDVVGFGAGEPDFDTPQHVKDACAKALADGFIKDTPAAGIPELRQAIADKFKRDNGLDYKPSQIIVSCGGKHSCYNVILATCEEGDEVIIPSP